MPALRELQLQFVSALFDSQDHAVHAHVVADGIDAGERIDIYRNNLREGFINALAIGFPVIERLGGTDYFRQLAVEFLHAHPSRHGNLHHMGGPFPSWLRSKFDGTEYAYFADVAELEWAYQEALVAPDVPALPVDALRQVEPDLYEHVTFGFRPMCGFVRSEFPILRIWEANQSDAGSEELIDLASGGENAVVIRRELRVELHRLPDDQYAFLNALANGEPLGDALERALEVQQDFDAGRALQKLFELKLAAAIRKSRQAGDPEHA